MKEVFSLKGKTAVVTGGGSGIGRAISELFAARGAYVYILDLSEESGADAKEAILADGGSAEVLACNVADIASVKSAFSTIAEAKGKVDIVVNNAGVSAIGKLEETTEEDMDRVYNVNIKGVYNCSLEAVKVMPDGGSILNMASIASVVGVADRFAYSMTKGAVLTMTLSVAQDYIGQNIRCNCICPARIHTPFVDGYLAKNYPDTKDEMFKKLSEYQPIGRMGKPEEVAAMALYLVSDEASFITASAYPIDGGVINLT